MAKDHIIASDAGLASVCIPPDVPVILMLMPSEEASEAFITSRFAERFTLTFLESVQETGTFMAFIPMGTNESPQAFIDAWIDRANTHIKRLGNRYKGTLIHYGNIYGQTDVERIDRWTRSLLGWRKPIVCFDSTGTADFFTRSRYSSSLVFKLVLDEQAAATTAVEYLASLGHSRIGYPMASGISPAWIRARGEQLRRAAMNRDPIEITFVNQTESFLSTFSNQARKKALSDHVKQIAGADIESLRAERLALLSQTPSVAQLLREQVTAIICPNDTIACEYRLWFIALGIGIPQDISLIAFDNTADAYLNCITTVDFGFARLGSYASRILLGGEPVDTDDDGAIRGTCRVSINGSVAPPRSGMLKV